MHHWLWTIDYGSKSVFHIIRVIYNRGQDSQESAFIVKMTADDFIINDLSKPNFSQSLRAFVGASKPFRLQEAFNLKIQ